MSSRALRAIALLVILASLLTGRHASAFHEDTLLTDAPGVQTGGRTDGEWVVWLDRGDQPTDGADIYAARVNERIAFPVATGSVDKTSPDIDNGVVVWGSTDIRTDLWLVNTLNLMTGERNSIASSISPINPRISGMQVVWSDRDHLLDRPILLTDGISTEAPPTVLATALDGAEDIWDVEISGTHVFWWEGFFSDRSWTWWIRTVDLAGADPGTPVTIAEGSMYPPSFDVGGDILVYSDNLALHVVDLTSGTTAPIYQVTPPQLQTPRDPTTDGRYVFWQDDTRHNGELHASLMGYDLMTNTLYADIVNTGTQQMLQPDTAAGYLVWHTGSDQDRDIHAASLVDLLPGRDWRYYPETGHYLSGQFCDFWESNGGLPVFGYPLTEEFVASNTDSGRFLTVQYVERQRYEWHPENAGTPYEVLLGRLGAQLLEQQGRDWTTFAKADPATPYYVQETGHAIAPEFSGYWSSHGLEFGDDGVSYRESLALFGYPISPPMIETNADGDTVLTQYFERAVFEHHPGNPTEYQVLLRRVGAELLAARGW